MKIMKKLLHFILIIPKPLIDRYKFIKGFEEGILDFYSVQKNVSNQYLKL